MEGIVVALIGLAGSALSSILGVLASAKLTSSPMANCVIIMFFLKERRNNGNGCRKA